MDAADKFNWQVADVADYLGRAVEWVYDNYRDLGIPHAKVGQGVRFRPRDVQRWAESRMAGAS